MELDGTTQQPTGILKETAVELVTAAIAQYRTQADKRKYLSEGMALCARLGLTAVQTNDDHCLAVYQQLQKEDALPLRVFLTPNHDELRHRQTDQAGILGFAPSRPQGLAVGGTGSLDTVSSRLIVERLKVYSDGSLGAETAALRTAADRTADDTPSHTGVLVHKTESLRDIIRSTVEAAYRVEIHAIGDAAAEQVLDALQHNLPDPAASTEYRPILTHCQVLGEDLVERMARFGVVANVQPSFVPTGDVEFTALVELCFLIPALSDMRWVQARLTAAKQQYSYAWRTLLAQGVMVAGGSDAPIESPSPFIGMFDAVHRSNQMRLGAADQSDAQEFRPEEKLSFAEALWLYTVGAAYAAKCEHVLGRVEAGFAADLVVVDPRVAEDSSLLHQLQPDMVFVGGVVSHASTDFTQYATSGSSSSALAKSTPTPFHDAPYVPGKGGCISRVDKYRVAKPQADQNHDNVCADNQMSNEAFCACILKGKYCMEVSKLR